MNHNVVTSSHSDEELTLIDTVSGDASSIEGGLASGSESATTLESRFDKSLGSKSTIACGSNSQGSTRSMDQEQEASCDESTSLGALNAPKIDDPTPVANEPNRWCVEGQ